MSPPEKPNVTCPFSEKQSKAAKGLVQIPHRTSPRCAISARHAFPAAHARLPLNRLLFPSSAAQFRADRAAIHVIRPRCCRPLRERPSTSRPRASSPPVAVRDGGRPAAPRVHRVHERQPLVQGEPAQAREGAREHQPADQAADQGSQGPPERRET